MESFRIIISLCFCLFVTSTLEASIYCPPAKTLTCHDDIKNLTFTGRATTSGYPAALVRYTDIYATNKCNVGTITRIWYIDINQDYIYQSTEPNCSQTITILSDVTPITVTFPEDKMYTCKESITYEKPSWVAGPCDVMGIQVSDTKFEINGESCYKIARKFTVINWCDYTGNPGSQGVWSHTQKITVQEKNPPKILDCAHKVFELESDCLANVVLTNTATDDPVCKSTHLSWIAEIDLWANGTIDYKFGFTETGIYKIDPVADGYNVSIKIPEKLKAGKHKVKWSVKDQCGNFSSCSTTFETKDKKPPVPYIQDFITSAFQASGMPLMIPARLFDFGSFDHCSQQKYLRFSFSEDTQDTIRIVDCTNSGFQFFNVFIWDEAGNYEIVDVFMLVFDNGSCQSGRTLDGSVIESNLSPVKNAKITLSRPDSTQISVYSDEKGKFRWDNISIYDDYSISAQSGIIEDYRVDIADLRMLQDHIFGIRELKSHEWLAADTDDNNAIGVGDLTVIKELIIDPAKVKNSRWKFGWQTDTLMTKDEIFSSVKPSINIKQVKGKLQFKAVYKGDISDANEIKSTVRNKIDMTSVIEGNQVHYYLFEDVKVSGIQITVTFPNGLTHASIASTYSDIKQNNFYINHQTNEILILNTSDLVLTPNKPIFTITFPDDVEMNPVMIAPNSKLLSDGYQTRTISEKYVNKNFQNLSVFPNPGHQFFTISGAKNATITGIYDINGKSLPFRHEKETFYFSGEPGLYFVKVFSGNDVHTLKLLKL